MDQKWHFSDWIPWSVYSPWSSVVSNIKGSSLYLIVLNTNLALLFAYSFWMKQFHRDFVYYEYDYSSDNFCMFLNMDQIFIEFKTRIRQHIILRKFMLKRSRHEFFNGCIFWLLHEYQNDNMAKDLLASKLLNFLVNF